MIILELGQFVRFQKCLCTLIVSACQLQNSRVIKQIGKLIIPLFFSQGFKRGHGRFHVATTHIMDSAPNLSLIGGTSCQYKYGEEYKKCPSKSAGTYIPK